MNTHIPVFLTVAALATAAQAAPYVSPDGYKITPPAGWTLHAKNAAPHNVYFDSPTTAAIDIFDSPSSAAIGIFDSKLGAGETPAGDMTQLVAALKKQFLNFKVISQHNGFLAGEPDVDMVATYTTQTTNLPLRFRQVFTTHGRTTYSFSLTASQQHYAVTALLFAKALRTVRWTIK